MRLSAPAASVSSSLSPVAITGPQQRPAVQVQQVERPELDPGGARPVLHLGESGHAGRVEGDDLAVEHGVMVSEIGCDRNAVGGIPW